MMHYFQLLPGSITQIQQLYDYFIPTVFIVCFSLSLPKKLTALRYASFVTACVNLLLTIVVLWLNNS